MEKLRPSATGITALLVVLCACSAASVTLISIRMQQTNSQELEFLRWNLALAWLPMMLGLTTFVAHRWHWPAPIVVSAGIAWLIFLPNAPYLVTDMVHAGNTWQAVPLWFDIVMFATFGGTGLLLGYASLYLVHVVVADRFGTVAGWALTLATLVLSGTGIYLGRVLRLNSWDPAMQPELFLSIARRRLEAPLENPGLYTVIALMSVMLALGYLLFVASARIAGGVMERRMGRNF